MRALLVVLALLLLCGCEGRHQGMLIPETRTDDPRDVSGIGLRGKWTRSENSDGFAYLVVHDDSTIQCITTFRAYCYWGPQHKSRGQYQRGIAIFDIHINPDSTLSSRFVSAWQVDSNKVFTRSIPDSLGAPYGSVRGQFCSPDSFYIGQVYDSTLSYWISVYRYEPGFRICTVFGAAYLDSSSVCEHLRRTYIWPLTPSVENEWQRQALEIAKQSPTPDPAYRNDD